MAETRMESSGGKKISRRVNSIEVSATKEMPVLARKVGGCVSLGQGVPSFPTPDFIELYVE